MEAIKWLVLICTNIMEAHVKREEGRTQLMWCSRQFPVDIATL
jgi:hypothetical protein